MDVFILGEKSIRIKGKKGSFVIDPDLSIGKTEADAAIKLASDESFSINKLEGVRVTFSGPGEYEVGGIKMLIMRSGNESAAIFNVDNLNILIGSGSVLEKIQDKVESPDIVIVNANLEFNYSVVTAFEPKVIIVYGDKKDEVKNTLGKEGEKTTKFSVTKEKLSDEMQLILFG